MKTLEEFLAFAKELRGISKRYDYTPYGMVEETNGHYVTWETYFDKVTKLTLEINKLRLEKNNTYNLSSTN